MEDDSMSAGTGGMDRRQLLKRSAVVGGALVWTTPVVQSIASPAFAQTSPSTQGCVNARLVAVKFDGSEDTLNRNQCVPAGASLSTPLGDLIGTSTITSTTLTFTLGPGDTFISICVIGGNATLTVSETSRVTNANGSTTFTFTAAAGQSGISNFSVFFADCP